MKVKKCWHHLLYADISFFATRKCEKTQKSMKIVNTEGQNVHIFCTTWRIAIKFSEMTWLIPSILRPAKNCRTSNTNKLNPETPNSGTRNPRTPNPGTSYLGHLILVYLILGLWIQGHLILRHLIHWHLILRRLIPGRNFDLKKYPIMCRLFFLLIMNVCNNKDHKGWITKAKWEIC